MWWHYSDSDELTVSTKATSDYVQNYDYSNTIKHNQWYEDEAVKARICSEEKKKKQQKKLLAKQKHESAEQLEFQKK